MFKRLFTITGRDLKSGFRDWLYIYIFLAPLLFAYLLKAVIPGVGSTTINIAVLESIDQEVVDHLETYAKVEKFADLEAIEERVTQTDDVFGLIQKPDGYNIVQQGNEMEGTIKILQFAVNSYENKDMELPVEVVLSDIGWRMSPWKQNGAIMMILMNTVIGAMLIVMSIVEEKVSNTLAMLNVTPLTRFQFVIGKSLPGVILPVFGAFAIFWVVGFSGIDYAMVTVVVFATSLISMIFGFSVALYNTDMMEAIGSLKMILLPVYASVAGYIMLDPEWHWTFYWSPYYWAYEVLDHIILETATWEMVAMNSSIILLITALSFVAMSKKIRQGMV